MTTIRTGVKTVPRGSDPTKCCRTYKSAPPPPKITQRARAMHIERACLAGWQEKGKRRKNKHGWATKER